MFFDKKNGLGTLGIKVSIRRGLRPKEGRFRPVPMGVSYNCGVPATAVRAVMT